MNSVRRMGHVVGSVDRYLTVLVESLKERGVESKVFETGLSQGDPVQQSDRLAQDIRDAGLRIVFFHADSSDPIAARAASLRAAPIQVNVNHGVEMDGEFFDGVVHLTQNAMERSRFGSLPSVWIPPSTDIEKDLQSATFETRESLALNSEASVSATLSAPARDRSVGFIRTVIEILRRYPNHF